MLSNNLLQIVEIYITPKRGGEVREMKIAVFGATGKTGMQVVQQALEQGIEVKAFVRDSQKMTIKNDKLSFVQGDVVKSETVDAGVDGVDAVVVALGPKPDGGNVMAQGTTNIIKFMKKHNTKRLIVQSSYPMSGSPEGMEFLKNSGMTEEQITLARPMIDDKIKQESETRESGLDYLIIRPLSLTDGEKTGKYRVGEKLDVKPGDSISRADVADFMLKSLTNNEWLDKTVVISY
ncbi:NAD(P)H-binding protein [Candidatus Microgenomates bacterium]|nr:NAD(P)H-binding protein [Candidatus Microgenomates bacterium]